ncbi:MAG: hypothetical protein ACKOT0_01745, partial [bacterium]
MPASAVVADPAGSADLADVGAAFGFAAAFFAVAFRGRGTVAGVGAAASAADGSGAAASAADDSGAAASAADDSGAAASAA